MRAEHHRQKPYQINRLGIARTFQNIRLFKNMTVLDNIKVAMNQNMSYSVVSGMFRLPSYWKQEKAVGEGPGAAAAVRHGGRG